MSWKTVTGHFRTWHRTRECIRELARLSDRELADIGIHRADIEFVVRKGLRDG